MAASSSSPCSNSPAMKYSPVDLNTTFIEADPSSFRTVVQRLTGASPDSLTHKLPNINPSRGEMGPRKSHFKLHERTKSAKKLKIMRNNNGILIMGLQMNLLASPASTLGGQSPKKTMLIDMEEEEKAIAAKGFYLHKSPLSTPRGSEPEPELLTLFPLHSPYTHSSSY